MSSLRAFKIQKSRLASSSPVSVVSETQSPASEKTFVNSQTGGNSQKLEEKAKVVDAKFELPIPSGPANAKRIKQDQEPLEERKSFVEAAIQTENVETDLKAENLKLKQTLDSWVKESDERMTSIQATITAMKEFITETTKENLRLKTQIKHFTSPFAAPETPDNVNPQPKCDGMQIVQESPNVDAEGRAPRSLIGNLPTNIDDNENTIKPIRSPYQAVPESNPDGTITCPEDGCKYVGKNANAFASHKYLTHIRPEKNCPFCNKMIKTASFYRHKKVCAKKHENSTEESVESVN